MNRCNHILCVLFGLLSLVSAGDRKDVIVVGGGIAGMTAARTLLKSGKFDVKVYEGRNDRYGGRVWTNRQAGKGFKAVDVEMGSMFINTRAKNNPLHDLVKQLELKTTNAGQVQVMFPDQAEGLQVITGDNATNLYLEAFKVVMNAVKRIRTSGSDGPLLEVLLEQFELDKEHIGTTEIEQTMVLDIIKSLPTPLCRNFSTQLYEAENEFGWDSILVDGQDALVDRIVSGEGMELPIKVNLNKLVKNIKVDEKRGKVLVRTSDRKQAIVDAVVVAVPVGVLKEKSISFEPSLSVAWYKAIRDIGIGFSSKVIVKFDKAFWPKDVGSFLVSSSVATPGFLQMWTNTYRISGNPVLTGNIFGDQARRWDQAPLSKLKEKVKTILSQMFGAEVVTAHKIMKILRSDWSTDPLTLGSVSYAKVGNQPSLWETLQAPACPYIYFAGAYTESTNHVDSLHGAYNSGIRVAQQIIQNKCGIKEKPSNKRTSDRSQQTKSEKKSNNKSKKDEL